MYLTFHKVIFFRILGISICTVLSACDSSKSNDKQQGASDTQNSSSELALQQTPPRANASEGKKLTDLAGQATLPAMVEMKGQGQQSDVVSTKAEAFVGRYHVQMSCEDPFAKCDKGSAEFIIRF